MKGCSKVPTGYFLHSVLIVILCFLSIQSYPQVMKNSKIKTLSIPTRWTNRVSTENPLSEYPRPQLVRTNNWTNLNGVWQFALRDSSAGVPIIFDSEILVPYPVESVLSGIKKRVLPSESMWYRRTFNSSDQNNQVKTLLHFGAVDWQASVYFNDSLVGRHTGGYTDFTIDVSSVLKKGRNTIVVKVLDPSDRGIGPHGKQVLVPNNIYYTPSSGIWQTVWLETVPAIHITDLKFTPDIDEGKLDLRVSLSNVIPAKAGMTLEVVVLSDGKEVLKQAADDGKDNTIALKIPNFRLWSPEDPFLYDLIVRIKHKGKVVDEVKSYFGMRKISVAKDDKGVERIFLNNIPYYNLGILDQGFWPDGLYTAPTDSALAFDIKAIKAMGFNTIRKHIKVEPNRWYYHADKEGILVWQDFVNPNQRLPNGSKPAFELQLKETVDQLYNHPSIITWVLFNERWGQYDQKRLTEWVKILDSSRLINGHSGELLYVNNVLRSTSAEPYISSDMADIHSYPYPKLPPSISHKVQVLGEFGGIGVPVDGHIWDDLQVGWGYQGLGTPDTLSRLYSLMIDSLIALKDRGLSGSIFTQPFDVESEQNGLITYDRSVIKIPLELIREMNSKIVKSPPSTFRMLDYISVLDSVPPDYKELKKLYNAGRVDSLLFRRLSIIALSLKDTALAKEVSSKYLEVISSPLSEGNLLYTLHFTHSIDDKGFMILFNNRGVGDSILGPNVVENLIMSLIFSEKIAPHEKDSVIDWNRIERELIPKFGELAEEKINTSKLLYYKKKEDWVNFAKYYKLHFEKTLAVNRNRLHINNMSWPIFENVTDRSILECAIKVMKYNIDKYEPTNADALDTYANLLYKVGRKRDALAWELKALEASNNDVLFRKTYKKMLRGEKTWK